MGKEDPVPPILGWGQPTISSSTPARLDWPERREWFSRSLWSTTHTSQGVYPSLSLPVGVSHVVGGRASERAALHSNYGRLWSVALTTATEAHSKSTTLLTYQQQEQRCLTVIFFFLFCLLLAQQLCVVCAVR